MKKLMKRAHTITKNILRKGDSYRATLSLVLKMLHSLYTKKQYKVIKTLNTIEVSTKKVIDIKITEEIKNTYNECLKFINKKYEIVSEKSHKSEYNHNCIIGEKTTHSGNFRKMVRYEIKEVI